VKIGIIGSGDVARALGKGFVAEGHRVMLGSRDPTKDKLQAWLAQVGAAGATGSFADAAGFGEMVVVAVRGSATEAALGLAGPEHFAGKVVIDATNPLKMGADKQLTLGVGFSDSLGEAVQRALPGARVVKAFNAVNNAHMHKPDFPGGMPEMFICGDDAAAKGTAGEILDQFGWDVADMGGVEAARAIEPLCMLWCIPGLLSNEWTHAFALLR
jgi:predicted dinucleotide-binding enzyme